MSEHSRDESEPFFLEDDEEGGGLAKTQTWHENTVDSILRGKTLKLAFNQASRQKTNSKIQI